MEHNLVTDIATCIIAAWVVAVAAQVVRQPLLLAYLLAGFAIGPLGFRWVTEAASIQVISHIGLSLLLFMIGLEMDLRRMLKAGRIISVTAFAQIAGCVALGLVFFGFAGLAHDWLEALYLAVAAALSSTVIIIKILYDKRELDTLAGRITLGVLVLQDLFVIVFLAIQPDLKHPALGAFGAAVVKVALLVGAGYAISRFVLPAVFRMIARQPELVLVGAIAWCFALAGLAGYLGLSPEMGALIAGVMLSTFPYTLDVIAKVTTLRDFFVTLFFVGLGMSIPLPTQSMLIWMLSVSAFVIASRFLTVFPPLYAMRLGHRASFLPAVNLCQISELSLVLLALGKASGDVSDEAIGVVAFAFAFLAVASTYAIGRNDDLLRAVSPSLDRIGLPDLPATEAVGARAGAPAAHLRARILPDGELAARRRRAPEAAAARRSLRDRLQPGGRRAAAAARRRPDLRRHQPARHAAARRPGRRVHRHLLAARLAAQGHEQPAPRPAAAGDQRERADHRARRAPVRDRAALRRGRELRQRAAAPRVATTSCGRSRPRSCACSRERREQQRTQLRKRDEVIP